MSRSTDAYDAVKARLLVVAGDRISNKVHRWDGFLPDLVLKTGIVAGKPFVRIGIASEAPAVLRGAGLPALLDYTFSIDVVIANVTATNLEEQYRVLDEVTDLVSSGFYFNTGGESDWVLADTPFSNVTRGAVVPSVAPSADYISRGFPLSLKMTV